MRISDWSSDVCSSDLRAHVDDAVDLAFNLANGGAEVAHDLAPARGLEVVRHDARRVSTGLDAIPLLDQRRRLFLRGIDMAAAQERVLLRAPFLDAPVLDRKSVV